MKCEICGQPATHHCSGCGKNLCDSMKCAALAAAGAVKSNPIRAIANAPAAIGYQARRIADAATNALNLKP